IENKGVSDNHNNNNDIEGNNINLTHTNPNNNTDKDNIDNNNKNKYKVENGKVYEYKDGNWVLFGYTANNDNNNNDTTNSPTNSPINNTNNTTPNDSITDTIDIELGHNTYTLSFNRNNDYSIVARDFLLKNNLSLDYRNEIISFLNNNFNKEEYKIYKNININKIKEIIKDKIIIRILEYICDMSDIGGMSNDNGIWDDIGNDKDTIITTTTNTHITHVNNKYKIIY
ncbi:PLAA family ubiquitin binding protein, partial [Spraguea lophii 42_110]